MRGFFVDTFANGLRGPVRRKSSEQMAYIPTRDLMAAFFSNPGLVD